MKWKKSDYAFSNETPSTQDWKVLFRTGIKQMIIALQTPNGKIGKYVLTKKKAGIYYLNRSLDSG